MLFLDELAQMMASLCARLTALVQAGEPGQLGLQGMTLAAVAIQVNECVADHEFLAWVEGHAACFKVLMHRCIGLLSGTGVQCGQPKPGFDIVGKGHEMGLEGVDGVVNATRNDQRLLLGIFA